MFWVNAPLGVAGTLWAYRSLRDTGVRRRARIDWWGNATFAAGLTALLVAITYGIQPYGGHTQGWTNPWVLGGLLAGTAMLVVFVVVESRVRDPMFPLVLFGNAAFRRRNVASLLASVVRGGLQFMSKIAGVRGRTRRGVSSMA